MTEFQRGTDRLGRRAKRFLSPSQKYEIWLQLVSGETTISEAADQVGVDRSTIMRLRTIAKDGARCASGAGRLQARRGGRQAGRGAGGGSGRGGAVGRGAQGAGRSGAAGGRESRAAVTARPLVVA